MKKIKKFFYPVLALLYLLIFAGMWAYFVEPKMIKIEDIKLEFADYPDFKGMKFVQLSDIHLKQYGGREKKILKSLEDLQADFVFLTGDIVDWTTKDLESCSEFWQEIVVKYPGKVFAVLGNHEHRNPRFKVIFSLFEKSGIQILDNENRKIMNEDKSFYLIGVDDPHLYYDDLEKALAGVSEDLPKILLAHSPEIFRKVRDRNINLVLTGHTHGGQVNLPFLVNFIMPLHYDLQYKRGLFKEGKTYLYVSRGLGTTFLPLRFNSPPEITIIKIADSS